MTILRTSFVALAAVALSVDSANAQCSRARSYRPSFSPSYGYRSVRVIPQVSLRPRVRIHTTAYAPTAPVGLMPLPTQITFGGCSHVDDLANRLEYLMNELCLDLYFNYQHNHDFLATYTESYELFKLAQSIHDAQHNQDRNLMQQQLAGADALFHHIQDDLQGWTRIPRRQIGTLGTVARIEMAEETLHLLMEDVGVNLGPIIEEPPHPESIAPSRLSLPIPGASAMVVPEPPTLPLTVPEAPFQGFSR